MKKPRRIEPLIFTLRGRRVILDADLAELYGVQVKRVKVAICDLKGRPGSTSEIHALCLH
jgi:hypothetical protein